MRMERILGQIEHKDSLHRQHMKKLLLTIVQMRMNQILCNGMQITREIGREEGGGCGLVHPIQMTWIGFDTGASIIRCCKQLDARRWKNSIFVQDRWGEWMIEQMDAEVAIVLQVLIATGVMM